MSTRPKPMYGKRLVPQVLDELAQTNPDRVYAAIPRTADVEDGYHHITMADLARCVNCMARWIDDKFGRSTSFETMTYIGLSDLKGMVIHLATIKTGYKLLVPSPRNPASVNLHLMRETNSNIVLHAQELTLLIKPLKDLETSAVFISVPDLKVMLDSQPEHYSHRKTFEEARNDPIIILHSSGSTRLPKPVTLTNGSIGAYDNQYNMPAPAGREKIDSAFFTTYGADLRLYIVFPFFHLAGYIFFAIHGILNNITLVLGPPHIPPDGALLVQVSQIQKFNGMLAVPTTLEQLLHDPKGVDLLKNMDLVVYGGAPLSKVVGDGITGFTKLYAMIGSTETFQLPELAKSFEDWQYHEFSPYLKHEMRPYDADSGTFELVILADEDFAPVYHNLPGEIPFYTKDLFTKHPDKPNLYKFYGRRDDILVMANGEKVNPIPLEQYVQDTPDVKGVLLVGDGRAQTTLIVEPAQDLDSGIRAKFIDALWPRIQEANTLIPGPGRVIRGMVICGSCDKPFTRTAKGTIVRKLTEGIYKHEITLLYSGSSQHVKVPLQAKLKAVYVPAAIVEFLRQILAASFPPAAEFGEEEEFFTYGIDSIQVLEIVGALKSNLKDLTSHSVAWISPRTIFQHSTRADLSKLLAVYLNHGVVPAQHSASSHAPAVNDAVARHIEDLPPRNVSNMKPLPTTTIAILGSTGHVGAHLVATLLKNVSISRIYCLNRSDNAPTRQKEMLSKHNLFNENLLDKLVFMKIKLGSPRLGLNDEQYTEIASNVQVIVYNAWRLDFGLAIRSFEPFLHATRVLI